MNHNQYQADEIRTYEDIIRNPSALPHALPKSVRESVIEQINIIESIGNHANDPQSIEDCSYVKDELIKRINSIIMVFIVDTMIPTWERLAEKGNDFVDGYISNLLWSADSYYKERLKWNTDESNINMGKDKILHLTKKLRIEIDNFALFPDPVYSDIFSKLHYHFDLFNKEVDNLESNVLDYKNIKNEDTPRTIKMRQIKDQKAKAIFFARHLANYCRAHGKACNKEISETISTLFGIDYTENNVAKLMA